MGREHDDGNIFRLLLALEVLHNVAPILAGEQYIDQDEMGKSAVVQLFEVVTFIRGHDHVSLLFQDDLEKLQYIRLIVNNEDAFGQVLHRHLLPFFPLCYSRLTWSSCESIGKAT